MEGEIHDAEKLAVLLGYWIEHNREHIAENRAWMEKAGKAGLTEVAEHLKRAVELSEEVNHHMEHAREGVGEALEKVAHGHQDHRHAAHGPGGHAHHAESQGEHRRVHRHIELHGIGTIRTPYLEQVPQDISEEEGDGDFSVVVNEEFRDGLEKLDSFSHIYVLFYLDRPKGPSPMIVTPPMGGGVRVGVFSSRSPDRPNPIGLSVVRVLGVSGSVIRISPIDALDGTPLLDIKPYFRSSDCKPEAGDGWLGEVNIIG